MRFKARLIILAVILLFPAVVASLNLLFSSYALIWTALETLYYYPIYLVAGELFGKIEMGLIAPSLKGRFLTFLVYLLLFYLYLKANSALRNIRS